ncbi:methyltransferase domain-containing protein [Streptomyces griseoviridis]|uniref:Methyltransferase type 11 n=1 Tax=Streptomyces griseoviridis TaxID=45398 RepID=A0A918GR86_STRGD|nr:methyltransferase domain-containing protein [Streptomyces niveoruber]GGS56317.1 methyltransferase type 11 [Streptomyces niveoruber]
MSSPDRNPAVSHHYARWADAFVGLRGTRAMHAGYYTGAGDTATIADAADRLVRLAGRQLGLGPGHHLLDIGCGTGQPAVLLAEETGCRVAGVDASRDMLELGRCQAAGSVAADRISFHHSDATKLPFPDRSFDRALMIEVVSHVPDTAEDGKQAAFAEAARCLRPDGLLALVDMTAPSAAAAERRNWMDDVPSVHLTTRQRLLELLVAAGLEVRDVTDISPHVRHSGRRTQEVFDDHRQELAAALGSGTVERMARLVGQVAEAYENLGYLMVTARVR